MKKISVEVLAPKDMVAGEKFVVEVEIPEPVKKPRGQLHGLTLEEMSDEQLKRETINANSVLYKAKQRGAAEETIAANQARVDAVNAEKEKRGLNKPAIVATASAAIPNLASEFADETADSETAAEI